MQKVQNLQTMVKEKEIDDLTYEEMIHLIDTARWFNFNEGDRFHSLILEYFETYRRQHRKSIWKRLWRKTSSKNTADKQEKQKEFDLGIKNVCRNYLRTVEVITLAGWYDRLKEVEDKLTFFLSNWDPITEVDGISILDLYVEHLGTLKLWDLDAEVPVKGSAIPYVEIWRRIDISEIAKETFGEKGIRTVEDGLCEMTSVRDQMANEWYLRFIKATYQAAKIWFKEVPYIGSSSIKHLSKYDSKIPDFKDPKIKLLLMEEDNDVAKWCARGCQAMMNTIE